jgi:membrane protein DedA with SNARE-associated domain/rhodanese-related sulfurtransferase
MFSLMRLFEHHAYTILFTWVLAEQGGMPIPSLPVMLAAGTMSAAHRLHIAYVLPVILLACLIADSAWFFLGKRYGRKILNLLCRFSLESTTCVAKTQGTMMKRGAFTLLFAKFVPGLSTVAAPIAGQAGITYPVFVAYDMLGSLIWATSWLFAGRFFGDVAERNKNFFGLLERSAGALVLAGVVALVVHRLWKRRQFRTQLRGLRLEPTALMTLIEEAEQEGLERPFIVDLRHPLDVLSDPLVLPGALRIGPDELKKNRELIPTDRDIVLYCTCPSEETSMKVALELRRMGVTRVRPLRGGLQGWKDAGYPLDVVESVVPVPTLTPITLR